MSSNPKPELKAIKALTFDVFGTVVDWRSSVIAALSSQAARKTKSPGWASIPEEARSQVEMLKEEDWGIFAQEWRDMYKVFCHSFVPGVSEWKDIDTHHYDSLFELLKKWDLSGLYSEPEVRELSLVWHRLRPWEDASTGIHELGKRFTTSTLSNGNQELLRDLNAFGDLGFRNLISAADFKAYKPSPDVYLGAARELGVQPGEVAMVAAHLGDLRAAKACGMRTVYVERKDEEDWDPGEERYQQAKGWVDLWVSEGEGGFLEIARHLGISSKP
jgi:2-haloacid dehalogenase